ESRGVESDVIISKDALWGLAIKAPMTLDGLQGIRGIGPWRLAMYGEEIVTLMVRLRSEGL
ncbi:MAG: HRDC domain-containing protein, partial [Chloroflexota bacterium]